MLTELEPGRIGRIISRLTTLLAISAGIVLTAMAVLTVISITGRSLIWAGLGPIPGDFELVEMGAAIAVFGFLPYCHLRRGHVTVDLFVNRLSTRVFNVLTLFGDFTIAVISVVVAWRLWLGLGEKISYGESTMILGAPVWYAFLISFVGAAWMVVVGLHVLIRDARYIRAGVRLP